MFSFFSELVLFCSFVFFFSFVFNLKYTISLDPFAGKHVFIITNNPTRTIVDCVAKCKQLGFDMVPEDHIVNPGRVIAHMLAQEKSDLPVYLLGSAGLQVIRL